MNIFDGDAFKATNLTDAIKLSPFVPGRIGAMNLFSATTSFRNTVDLEYMEGTLGVLQTKERGSGQGDFITGDKRSIRAFRIPHLPARATIVADDLPDIRAFGTLDGRVAVNTVINERLHTMRQYMEFTLERWRAGLLKGKIYDADGSVLLDLFAEYDITPRTFEIDIAAQDSPGVRRLAAAVTRYIQDTLGATTYSYLHVLCGDTFFDNLVNCEEVKAAYNRPGNGEFLRELHVRDSVTYAGIVWENYRGGAGGTDFIAADEAIPIPMGVPGLFRQYYGPADTMEDVGRPGNRFVVTREKQKHDTGVELRGQVNTLMLVTRPAVLTKITDTSEPISGF